MMKNQRGITLIALVITIIVLLILAGVSIAMLTGENGILNKATSSRSATNEAEAVERINLALNAVKAEIYDQQVTEQNWKPLDGSNLKQEIKDSLKLDGFGTEPVTTITDDANSGKYVYSLSGTTLTLSYFSKTTEVGMNTTGTTPLVEPIKGTIDLSKSPYTVTEAK